MLPFPLPFPPPPPSSNHGRPPWLPDLPPPLRSSAAIDFRTTSAAFSSPFCPDWRCVYPGRGCEAWPAPPLAAAHCRPPPTLCCCSLLPSPLRRHLSFPCSSTHASTILQRLHPTTPHRCCHRLKKMDAGAFLLFVHFCPSTPHSPTQPHPPHPPRDVYLIHSYSAAMTTGGDDRQHHSFTGDLCSRPGPQKKTFLTRQGEYCEVR